MTITDATTQAAGSMDATSIKIVLGAVGLLIAGVLGAVAKIIQMVLKQQAQARDEQAKQQERLFKLIRGTGEDVKGAAREAVYKANSIPVSFLETNRNPCWVVDAKTLTMLYVNPAYTAKYGVRSQDYVGKRHREVWGDEIGGQFETHDAQVIRSRTGQMFWEMVPDRAGDPAHTAMKHLVEKWLIIDQRTRDVLYLCGTLYDRAVTHSDINDESKRDLAPRFINNTGDELGDDESQREAVP